MILHHARGYENYVQDVIVIFQNLRNRLEMKTFVAFASAVGKFHDIVFEAPFAALEWHHLVDEGKELGDC